MLVTDFLVERKAFRPRLVGGEIGRIKKKKKGVKIGERGVWLGGRVEGNFGRARCFLPYPTKILSLQF